jgi:hypothetical protein
MGPLDRNSKFQQNCRSGQDSDRRKIERSNKESDCLGISSETERLHPVTAQKKHTVRYEEALRREKLMAVSRRIENGYYNKKDIKNLIADKLFGSMEIYGSTEKKVQNDGDDIGENREEK